MKSNYWLRKIITLPMRGLYGGSILLERFTRGGLIKERRVTGYAVEAELRKFDIDSLFNENNIAMLVRQREVWA